jgi:cobalt-zinc-cadmium efflux system membrane fusion protein
MRAGINKVFGALAVMALAITGCTREGASDEHAGHNHEGHAHAAEAQEGESHAESGDGKVAMCGEHGVPEAECGICNPGVIGKLAAGESLKVRMPAEDSEASAGVAVVEPQTGKATDSIESFAQLSFNQNTLAHVSTPVGGIVQEVLADLGDKVREKQPVAKVWSAAIGEVVAKAVHTHQNLDRERKLRAERVNSQRDLEQAEAEHRAACQQARTFGFSEEQIDTFGDNPNEPVMLEVRAPFVGEIVERSAVRGALVEPGQALFTIVDRSTMWASLSIPESALGKVERGQTVELRIESIPGRVFTGKLTWISAEVDEKTRMATARAEVKNAEGLLKARMFAKARILTRSTDSAMLLPGSAVQTVDGNALVFVKLEPDLFEARAVRLGAETDGNFEILEGLKPGEQVVARSSFALKSQLLMSRLGAGCAHE